LENSWALKLFLIGRLIINLPIILGLKGEGGGLLRLGLIWVDHLGTLYWLKFPSFQQVWGKVNGGRPFGILIKARGKKGSRLLREGLKRGKNYLGHFWEAFKTFKTTRQGRQPRKLVLFPIRFGTILLYFPLGI